MQPGTGLHGTHDCIFRAHFNYWASYLRRCYKQKYARHVCGQSVHQNHVTSKRMEKVCTVASWFLFLVSTLNLYASDPTCRMQKHARNLSPQTLASKNDITTHTHIYIYITNYNHIQPDITKIGLRWSWFCFRWARGLFAYHIPKAATGNTRENVSVRWLGGKAPKPVRPETQHCSLPPIHCWSKQNSS